MFNVFQDRKFKFLVVGGIVFLLGFVGMKTLVDVLKMNASIAFAIVSFFSIEINFSLNYYWTWSGVGMGLKNLIEKWIKFHISRVFSILLNQIIFNALLLFHTHYLVSLVITTAVATIFNYILAEYFIFRQPSSNR